MKTWKVTFAALICTALMSLTTGADARTRGHASDSTAVSSFVWPRLRIGIDFGGGYGIGKTDSQLTSDLKAHANRLRIGAIAGADVSWFFMKRGDKRQTDVFELFCEHKLRILFVSSF